MRWAPRARLEPRGAHARRGQLGKDDGDGLRVNAHVQSGAGEWGAEQGACAGATSCGGFGTGPYPSPSPSPNPNPSPAPNPSSYPNPSQPRP